MGRSKKPPGKPPKKRKPPAGSDGHGHEQRRRQLQAKMDDALKQADLTDPQREEYRQATKNSLARMSPVALKRVHRSVREFRYYPSHAAVAAGIKAKYQSLRLKPATVIRGMFDRDGTAHLDGPGVMFTGKPERTANEFHAHELSHAIDRVMNKARPQYEISDTPEWQAIWREELTNSALIGQPGRKQAHEGFAEVGAYLLGHESVPEEVATAMRRAIQFWKDQDLLRGDDYE
jgi:hypothetical protein